MENNDTLKLYLKQWRKLRGLSQVELAEKTGNAVSYISMIENGKRDGMSIDFISKAAKALKCRPKDLFENPDREDYDLELLAVIELWPKIPKPARRAAKLMISGLSEYDEGANDPELPEFEPHPAFKD